MSSATTSKIAQSIAAFERKYGKVERPTVVPPPTSADAAAVAAVSAKNSQIVAGVVLGLHGPPAEGAEAAKKLMAHFVDWNEVRVSRATTLVAVLGRQSRAAERVALLQRFLEAYFLKQRSLNLDYLFTLKNHEVRRFLGELEVFERDELAAMFLTGFGIAVFPPSDVLKEAAEKSGLIKGKMTTLQVAKKFETSLSADEIYALYSHLYSFANDPDAHKNSKKKS